MKLVYVCRHCTLRGGQSRIAWEVAQEALRAGHEVHLVARRFPPSPHAAMTAHKTFQLPWFFGDFRFRSFARFSSRMAAALTEKAGIVHGFGDSYRQDILTLGNVDWNHPKHIPGRVPERAAVHIKKQALLDPRLQRLVVVSEPMKQDVLQLVPDFDPRKFRVIYPGVDVENFHPAKRGAARQTISDRYGIPIDALWIVTAAGGDFEKRNVATLAKALTRINHRKDWVFLCVGAEKGMFPWPAEIAGRSYFLGRLNDIGAVLPGGDLFAYPAWFDEFAMVCLEAMASGLPLVVSKTVGMSEVLSGANRVQGVLARPDDDAALAGALAKFLDDGVLRRAAGTANRETASGLSWPAIYRQYAALYEEVAEIKTAAAR